MTPSSPLTSVLVRLVWLRALCCVAEGSTVVTATAGTPVACCVAAVLGDAQKRLCALGGRECMPRSLGSVFGCFVTRFLGGLRGIECRRIRVPDVSWSSGFAISRDGATLLMSGYFGVQAICVATGVHVRTIGSVGIGPLQWMDPAHVSISSDGFVFVADKGNHRIQALTPGFEFHSFIGAGQLNSPIGVCADAETIVVSEPFEHRVDVFARRDGALLRRFGSRDTKDDGQLNHPLGLCFLAGGRRIAVANFGRNCISVFSTEGTFVQTMASVEGTLLSPRAVASLDGSDELFVAKVGGCLVGFSASGECLMTMVGYGWCLGRADFTAVAVHGSTIIALDHDSAMCIVFQ